MFDFAVCSCCSALILTLISNNIFTDLSRFYSWMSAGQTSLHASLKIPIEGAIDVLILS